MYGHPNDKVPRMDRQCFLCLLITLLMCGGCASSVTDLPQAHEAATVIYVMGHGWHTGIVVRRADLPSGVWPEHHDFPQATYVEVGWGDEGFYRAEEASFALALQAAFGSQGSVLHVVGLHVHPDIYFPQSEIVPVHVSHDGLTRLSQFIHDTYSRDAEGQTQHLGPGWYPDSAFYQARGTYHLLNTCNTWVAKALRAAGCPMVPAAAVTAENVLAQARQCDRYIPG